MTAIILDVDTGIDDALALLTAALSNEIDLVAATVTWGNVDVAQGARNTHAILDSVGHGDVPIAVGAAGPRTGAEAWFSPQVHGEDGLGGFADASHVPVLAEESAVDLIVRLSHEVDGLEIIAVGPLTNIAAALDADPTLPQRISQVTIMGGAALAPGNSTPSAEANIHHDPEAAAVVFAADWEVTMVGLDVTMVSTLEPEHLARLAAGGPVARHAASILDFYFDFYESEYGRRMAGNHDALALAVGCGLVKTTIAPVVHVEVDTSDGPGRGRTIADLRGQYGGYPAVDGARHRVVLEIEPGFEDVMVDLILSADGPSADQPS